MEVPSRPPEERDYRLMRDHIRDPDRMPSDEFLKKHFKLCLLRHFAGSPNLEIADTNKHMSMILDRHRYSVDLSEVGWMSGTGKQALELFFAQKLWGALVSSDDTEDQGRNRWPYWRFAETAKIRTPEENQKIEWPESFDDNLMKHVYDLSGRRIDPNLSTWILYLTFPTQNHLLAQVSSHIPQCGLMQVRQSTPFSR
jgi:hypothetical protein